MNLNTDYIDYLLIYSPKRLRSSKETLIVYSIFEEYFEKGIVKNLEISNIYSKELIELVNNTVKIKPKFIEIIFYWQIGYDQEIRKIL